ncbi:MAG: hypothetical protein M3450_17630 [Actinomycetota bacterium]|nr:hypothetical protein [Actinomycetota bacterium]
MASPKKFLASAAIAAGLLGGGVVGFVLGVPGVSGAQTTTVPDSPPTTTAPGEADRPARGDRENCPDKDGAGGSAPSGSSTGGSATNLDFRRGGGGGRV